jgi:hypothetical protein
MCTGLSVAAGSLIIETEIGGHQKDVAIPSRLGGAARREEKPKSWQQACLGKTNVRASLDERKTSSPGKTKALGWSCPVSVAQKPRRAARRRPPPRR